MRVAFDGFEIDSEGGVLLRGDRQVALERRAFQMLCYLVAHPGRLIDKRELLQEVWQVQALSDAVLSNTIAKLRKALGQVSGARSPIETVYGRGYRLMAKVRPLSVAGIARPDPQAFRSDVFVGRRDVMAFLVDRLEKALAGTAQLVVIEGEAGIGKTRTLSELSLRAHGLGVSSWFGRAYDQGAPPYWPWRELLRAAHADLGPGNWRWHLPRDVWALPRFAPELFDRGAELSTPDTEVLRFRLFDELARLLRSAGREAPRLVVLDDLHASDGASVELLSYLVRMLQDSPIVFAASVRTHEALDEFTAQGLRRLRRDAASVVLDGLSVPDVSQLVAALTHVRIRSAQVDSLLHERSGGNPFFVRQIVELLAQRGLPLDHRQLAALELPPGICEVVERRLAALPEAAQRVLRAAAVLGREFDAALLATILGDDLEHVVAALEPARRLEMIAPCTVSQRFAFTHSLLCDVLYDGLTLSERGAFHGSAARALAARPCRVEPQHLAEVARHALRALPCDIESCLAHCSRAADAARAAAGYETAAELGSRAAEKLASEGGDEHERCELLLAAGFDHFCAGHVETAWRTLRSGAQLARHRGDPRQLAQCAFRLADCVESGVGDESEVRADLEYAIELAGDSDPGLSAALLAHRAELGFDLESAPRSALFTRAQSLAERSGDAGALLEVASSRAVVRDPAALDDNRAAVEAWNALVQAHPDAVIGLRYGGFRRFAIGVTSYLCDLTAGDLHAAEASYARCRAVAEHSHLPALGLVVQLMAAGRELAAGHLTALKQSIRALSHAPAENGVLGLGWRSFYVDWLEAHGKSDVLRGVTLEDPVNSPVLGPRQRMHTALKRARLHARFGRRTEARVLLLRIPAGELSRMPIMYGDLGLLCELAETYALLEDLNGVRRVYAQLEPHAARNAVGPAFQYLGSVSHYLGVLAMFLGQHARALAHFDEALAMNERLAMPLQLELTRANRSDLLRRCLP